jgi:hypothetical protein
MRGACRLGTFRLLKAPSAHLVIGYQRAFVTNVSNTKLGDARGIPDADREINYKHSRKKQNARSEEQKHVSRLAQINKHCRYRSQFGFQRALCQMCANYVAAL